jgi:hypothetical protein
MIRYSGVTFSAGWAVGSSGVAPAGGRGVSTAVGAVSTAGKGVSVTGGPISIDGSGVLSEGSGVFRDGNGVVTGGGPIPSEGNEGGAWISSSVAPHATALPAPTRATTSVSVN